MNRRSRIEQGAITVNLLYVATEHDVSLGTAIHIWDHRARVDGRLGTLDQLANATGTSAMRLISARRIGSVIE